MTAPRISVVLPTLNEVEYVGTAIQSVLSQTFADFELIIVDGGSTDGTLDVIESFDDDRINLIVRDETPNNLSKAINMGIENAVGEYIARHDADDWSHETRFDRQVDYLDTNPGVGLVGTAAHLVDEDGESLNQTWAVLESPTLVDFFENIRVIIGSCMFRREVYDTVGGMRSVFRVAEDYDFLLRVLEEYPIRNIPDPLYVSRKNATSWYAQNIEETYLYVHLAQLCVAGSPGPSILDRVESDGPEIVYMLMSLSEQHQYHETVARESLRFGYAKTGREHARKALDKSLSITPFVWWFLSFLGTPITQFIEKVYRKLVVNPAIAWRNRFT